jgi:hypothetical protein
MSPLVPVNVPTAFHSGQAFPFTGLVRPPALTVSPGLRVIIFATNTGKGPTVVNVMSITSVLSQVMSQIPTLDFTSANGGPTSARAMKHSIGILNTTAPLSRSGRVYTLTCDSRISVPTNPSTLTAAHAEALADTITAHPDTLSYDGSHFGEERTLVSHVIDHADYSTFEPWAGNDNIEDFMRHGLSWPDGPDTRSRPMTSQWIVIDKVPAANVYALTVRASYYTRWSIDSVPGQSHKKMPTASVSVVNSIHEAAEKFAGVLHTVNSLATAGSTAMLGIQSGMAAAGRVRPMMALMP